MADKYLKVAAGQIAEQAAIATSAGAGDAGKIPALDSSGRLDASMMPVGIGADTKVIVSSENLAAGDLVNIWNDSGTAKARKADASNGRRAHGFVLAAVTSSNNATVYNEGTITGLTGLTAGTVMYLSGTTAGAATATPTTTSGHISQDIGVALSDSEIGFEPQRPITLA